MGTVQNILEQWAAGDPKKEEIYVSVPKLALRWINEAQLRHASLSEILRTTWSPTITSTGNIALPSDFLREIPDRVKWTATQHLVKIDYPTANLVESFSGTYYYSIYGETFYVWEAAAGTPTIPYIKKPTALTTIATDALEIPTEFHGTLLIYFDAMYLRKEGDYAGSQVLLRQFDSQAAEDGAKYRSRRDGTMFIRSSLF